MPGRVRECLVSCFDVGVAGKALAEALSRHPGDGNVGLVMAFRLVWKKDEFAKLAAIFRECFALLRDMCSE